MHFAGSSIPDHFHMHVVPRYKGNLSFIHTIGNLDVICYDLEKVYETLVPPFKELEAHLISAKTE